MTPRPALPYLWMLCGSVSFSFMAFFTGLLRTHCDWRVTALARSGLATVFAVSLCLAAGRQLVVWRPAVLWWRSTAGSVSLLCTFYALARLPIDDVLTLTNMFPIWVAVLSWPLLHEAPTASVVVSALSGVAGVVLIQQPHFAAGNYATLLALLASLSSAVAMLGLNRLAGIDARAIVAHFSGVSTLAVVAALVALPGSEGRPVSVPDGVGLVLLLGVGLTATVGQLFLTLAFTSGSPSKVSVVGLTQIVFVMLLEWLRQPRHYGWETLAGMALVIAPTAWVLSRGRGRRVFTAEDAKDAEKTGKR